MQLTIGTELRRNGSIPFDKMHDDDAMRADGLDPQWFGCSALMPSFT